MEKLTNHFYMVSLDLLNGSGADNLHQELSDAQLKQQEYLKYLQDEQLHGFVTIYKYELTDQQLEELDYDIELFFDNLPDGSMIVSKRSFLN